MNYPASQNVEENRLARRRIIQWRVGQRHNRAQRVFAMVLDGARIGIFKIVERSVVSGHLADIREIESLISKRMKHRKVGIVRQQFVHRVVDRTGHRMRHGARVHLNQPVVRASGFKHQAAAGRPAGLHVHYRAHLFGPWMRLHKSVRAQQPLLFPFIEQQNNRMPGGPARFQNPRHFQIHRHPRAVIRSARPGRHRIVVRRQQHRRPSRFRAVQARQYVLHAGACAPFIAREAGLNRGLITQPREDRHQSSPHRCRRDASPRMRHPVAHQFSEQRLGTRAGKLGGRNTRRFRCGRQICLAGEQRGKGNECQSEEEGLLGGPTFQRSAGSGRQSDARMRRRTSQIQPGPRAAYRRSLQEPITTERIGTDTRRKYRTTRG